MNFMDARIGILNSGLYYAYADGYDAEPTTGTLHDVMSALGLVNPGEEAKKPGTINKAEISSFKTYNVNISFEYPAWNEREGIEYQGITAKTKRDAIRIVRSLADSDGHLGTGRGRYWLKAVLQ